MDFKDFLIGLLGQQSDEEKQKIIDFLRGIWDYYEENYLWPSFGIDDEGRVDFLNDVFLEPLLNATDEVAEEIGYKPSREKVIRQINKDETEMFAEAFSH